MDVAHKDLVDVLLTDVACYAFAHATCSPVGEGEAEHIAEGHALLVSLAQPLGQNLRLSASRWRQHQMVAAMDADDFLLTWVWGHLRLILVATINQLMSIR